MNKDKYDKKIETTVGALLNLEEAILDIQSEFILEISGFGASVDTQIIDENIDEFNAKEEEMIELENLVTTCTYEGFGYDYGAQSNGKWTISFLTILGRMNMNLMYMLL